MVESRWRRWIGTGVISIVGVASIASVTAGAAQRPWTPVDCPDGAGNRTAAAKWDGAVDLDTLANEAWFRLDPRLDRDGALAGQRLSVGLDGERGSRVLDLPPESFAAGPFGRVVLVGGDDGSVSRIRALDVAGQCAWDVDEATDVIRRATIDPAGVAIYEMRVDRATRADLGIWSRPIDGSRPAARVLEPIAADDRFGRTFSTEFAWDLGGSGLVIQSCGEIACRSRVVAQDGGNVRMVDTPDLGSLIGLDGDRMVTYAACPGLPCPVIATNLATGLRSELAGAAATAVLVSTEAGARLVHEVLEDTGVRLRAVALDGSSVVDLGPLPVGLRLHASPQTAGAATRIGWGWVLLSPEGRIPDNGPRARTLLRRVTDGMTVQLEETIR
jgi:hypothetical protein